MDKPQTPKIIPINTKTRSAATYYNYVTPEDFKSAFRQAKNGNPNRLFEIMEWFQQMDGHLGGTVQQLISSVSATDYSLSVINEDKQSQDVIKTIEDVLDKMRYTELLEELLQFSYYGYRAINLEWRGIEIDGKLVTAPSDWDVIPHHMIWAEQDNNQKTSKLMIGDRPADDYPSFQIAQISAKKMSKLRTIDFTKLGRGLAAIRFVIMKYYNMDDWAAFNEIFGIPMILGIVNEGANADAVKKVEETVEGMANASRGVIYGTTDIKVIDGKVSGSYNVYDELCKRADLEISKAITSQTLTSSDGDVGTYGAMVTANGIKLDVAMAMALKLDNCVQTTIIDEIVKRNWPSYSGRVRFKTNIRKVENLLDHVRVDRELFEMGMPVSKQHLRTKYNYPDAIEDDDRLQKPVSANFLGE